jgi:hypothetical protein
MSKRDRIKKIESSLDLGFSDFYKDENVRQLTLGKKLDKIENAEKLKTLEEYMNYSVFDQRGTKHPTAQIYAIDFPSDLRASIYLLLGGYYRQAILCLRNWFEIRLTGIYFGFVNTDRRHYREWKKGKRPAPIGQDLIKKLFSRGEFHKIDKKVQLRDRLRSLYRELSAFTHGAILERYPLQSETDNVPRFNPQSVDLWYDFVLLVFGELVFCYFLAYGKDAFHMGKQELKILRQHLPDLYQKELQEGGIF